MADRLFMWSRIEYIGGWWNWDLEAIDSDAILRRGGFNEQAGGATQTKLAARLKLWRAKKRMRDWASEATKEVVR